MWYRKWFVLFVIFNLACSLGNSLSNIVNRGKTPISENSTPAITEKSTPATPLEPPVKLAKKQVFVLPGGDPPTLDPHLGGDATSAEYLVEIFSGLMVYDQQLNLIPDLAENYKISDDGLIYTFKIKPSAKFQDGKPIRAKDFQWSFERACDPKTGSSTADTYMGDIVGCRDKLQDKANTVKGVVVIDDLTLQLTIDEPKGFFLAKMTYPTAYVLDRENVASGGKNWFKKPNSSGPFKVEEFSPAENVIILARNENYYRDPKPILERVIYLVDVPVDLMSGYEDDLGLDEKMTYDAVPVGTNNMSRVTDPNNPLSKEFVSANAFSLFYIGFNVHKPPFDDPKIRQAFNLALDKKRLVKLAFQGTVTAANGIVPPNMPNYQNSDVGAYQFDPKRAQALIAESKYQEASELPDITMHVSGAGGYTDPFLESVVESYQKNLGIKVNVEQSDWGEFLDGLNTNTAYQIYQLGWVADYPDPQNFLEVLFHSKSKQNHGGYSNPKVDELLDKARVSAESAVRLKLYQQAEQMILDDAALVPIYFDVDNWLVKPYVKGFMVPPMKIPRLQYISIAEH